MENANKILASSFALLMIAGALAIPANATIIAQETFATGFDGWTGQFEYDSTGQFVKTYLGGSCGICWAYISSPDAKGPFSGNLTALFGGNVTFDFTEYLNANLRDLVDPSSLTIVGQDGRQMMWSFTGGPFSAGVPQTIDVPIVTKAGDTDADLLSLLGEVRYMEIEVAYPSYLTANQVVGLDNITLNTLDGAPEPATLGIVAAALIGLAAWRRRKLA